MKDLIMFEMDGQPVYVEAELSESEKMQRVATHRSSSKSGPIRAESRFKEAVERIKPAAEVVLKSFREMNTPDEIGLEFGLKFNAKAGVVFASTDSEATFKVSLKWTNKKE